MPRSSIAGVRILVIDEDARARGVLIDELQALGATDIRETGDPLEALEVMRCGAADLLVSERYLHLIRFIRANSHPEIGALPIVVVSAHHRDADIHETIDAGVDEFVPKPVEPVALLEGLMRALTSRQGFVRSGAYIGPDRRQRRVAAGEPAMAADDAPIAAHWTLTPEEIEALLRT